MSGAVNVDLPKVRVCRTVNRGIGTLVIYRDQAIAFRVHLQTLNAAKNSELLSIFIGLKRRIRQPIKLVYLFERFENR